MHLAHGAEEGVSALGKVIELISNVHAKTIKDPCVPATVAQALACPRVPCNSLTCPYLPASFSVCSSRVWLGFRLAQIWI